MFFQNLPIVRKFAAAVFLLAAAAALVAGFGLVELGRLSGSLLEVGRQEVSAREAMDLRIDIIAISRMTYQLAQAPEQAADFRKESEKRAGEMRERFPVLRKTADAEVSRLLDTISLTLDGYFAAIRSMVDVAAAGSGDAAALRKALDTALVEQKKVTDSVKVYSTLTNDKMSALRTAAEAEASESRSLMWITAIGGILAGVAAALLVGQIGIVRPVRVLTVTMGRLAEGGTDTTVDGTRRGDEIGGMARAVEVFRANMIRTGELEAAARRDREALDSQRRATVIEMANGFERAVGSVVDGISTAATELCATAQSLTATAETTAARSASVDTAAKEASDNVVIVAGASEELGSSVGEISRQITLSSEMSAGAVSRVEEATTVVRQLSESASRIGAVVELISAIAAQTNLLALNATIEAARAGDAGRGFAVVAAEVKQLADQTAVATEKITTQIGEIRTSSERAVGAIGTIDKAIEAMNRTASVIASAADQQSIATREIVASVALASSGTSAVSAEIGEVARSAEDTGAAAGQVLAASSELSQQAETLRGRLGEFLATVRAA